MNRHQRRHLIDLSTRLHHVTRRSRPCRPCGGTGRGITMFRSCVACRGWGLLPDIGKRGQKHLGKRGGR